MVVYNVKLNGIVALSSRVQSSLFLIHLSNLKVVYTPWLLADSIKRLNKKDPVNVTHARFKVQADCISLLWVFHWTLLRKRKDSPFSPVLAWVSVTCLGMSRAQNIAKRTPVFRAACYDQRGIREVSAGCVRGRGGGCLVNTWSC